MVKMLMNCKRLNLDEKNEQGRNAVHVAAMHDRLNVIKYIVAKHEDSIRQKNFEQDGKNA